MFILKFYVVIFLDLKQLKTYENHNISNSFLHNIPIKNGNHGTFFLIEESSGDNII